MKLFDVIDPISAHSNTITYLKVAGKGYVKTNRNLPDTQNRRYLVNNDTNELLCPSQTYTRLTKTASIHSSCDLSALECPQRFVNFVSDCAAKWLGETCNGVLAVGNCNQCFLCFRL